MNSFQKADPRKPERCFVCVVGRSICVLRMKVQQPGFQDLCEDHGTP